MAFFMILCRECIIDKNARIGKNVVIANSEVCFFTYFALKDQGDKDVGDGQSLSYVRIFDFG